MRILIAEDDPVTRRALEAALTKAGYQVLTACDGAGAWEILQGLEAPRLAILDWMMPGMDGPQVCREVRKRNDRTYVYLILLTSRDRKQDVIEGLEAGADDYLTKPFDAFELKARLNVGRRILGLQGQLLEVCEELRRRASMDPLTGVYNRGAILELLEQEWARARREEIPLGILMADLDHFKHINDAHGHPAGDAVLREVTRRLRAVLRAYDAVGRYGGEEFLIIMPRCRAEHIVGLAERLRESIAAGPVCVGPNSIPVTVSLGVSVSENGTGDSLQQLLQAADAALYRAKYEGRNRVVLAGAQEPELAEASA
jgi:diguanylate cyclase (GGDEF)-like protein